MTHGRVRSGRMKPYMVRALLAALALAPALLVAAPAAGGSGKSAPKKAAPRKTAPPRKALPQAPADPTGTYALDTAAVRAYAEALTRMDAKMRVEMILTGRPTLVFEPDGQGQRWTEVPSEEAIPPARESAPFRWSQKGGRLSLTRGGQRQAWMTCTAEGEKLRCDEQGLSIVYLRR